PTHKDPQTTVVGPISFVFLPSKLPINSLSALHSTSYPLIPRRLILRFSIFVDLPSAPSLVHPSMPFRSFNSRRYRSVTIPDDTCTELNGDLIVSYVANSYEDLSGDNDLSLISPPPHFRMSSPC